jgi:hypothetical protein
MDLNEFYTYLESDFIILWKTMYTLSCSRFILVLRYIACTYTADTRLAQIKRTVLCNPKGAVNIILVVLYLLLTN